MAECLTASVENTPMSVITEQIRSIVQEKFLSNERVVCIVCRCRVGYSDIERILAVVECGEERAVFCLVYHNYPPNTFSDLSIERVIPVDPHFKFEIDQRQHDVDVLLYLIIISSKLRLELELREKCVNNFVDELFRSMEAVDNFHSTQTFEWLQKYTGASETTSTGSPQMIPRRARDVSLAARESRIKYEMLLKESEYTNKKTFTVFVATWNVNDKSPSMSLGGWLCAEAESPDIYAIGFQELDLSLLFDASGREEEWSEAVLSGIDARAKYALVDRVRLVGMMLLVLIKEQHRPFVRNVSCDTVGTGLMGKLGNKGGVSIRFDLHNTSMCFVNSHLAAHTDELERRNQDYRDICNRTQFHVEASPPRFIKDHDQIYWLGDLNYRITDVDTQKVKSLLDRGQFEIILENDQLTRQRRANNVFVGYQEGFVTFRPTYKYDPGTDDWDSSEKSRTPAWCDRILWRGEDVEQSAYRSHPALNASDHKPVSATFRSQVKLVVEERHRRVYEEVIKKLDKLENELIPQVTLDRTEVEFGRVRFLEPHAQRLLVANTGQVPAAFSFISKLDESSFCKPWLLVEPCAGRLLPGETCRIALEIFVNKRSASELNAGVDTLYDILVLHLEGGKDIFVTVTGTYLRSCFGCSVETLVHLKVPIREVSAAAVVELESRRGGAGGAGGAARAAYPVPKEVWLLVDHIYMHGLDEPNLFERPGVHAEVVRIRDWLDEGGGGAAPGGVHSVAEALLLLLESAGEPLVPHNLQDVCAAAADNYLHCKQLVLQLPRARRTLLLYLCEFLREALAHAPRNLLEPAALAALFAAILLRDRPGGQPSRRAHARKAQFLYHFLVNTHASLLFQERL